MGQFASTPRSAASFAVKNAILHCKIIQEIEINV